jgi:hypothetical protein
MQRYHKQFRKYIQEESSKLSLILIMILAVTLILQLWIWQNIFIRIDIDPISVDWIFSRLLYSALTFVTLGWVLFKVWFYKLLYAFFWKLFGYKFYKKIKKAIRVLLLGLMFFVIVPFVADLLNTILSRWYNWLRYISFISPALWVWLMIFLIGVLFHFQKKKTTSSLQ